MIYILPKNIVEIDEDSRDAKKKKIEINLGNCSWLKIMNKYQD